MLSFVYDIENRLVGSASSTGASPTVTIFYDPLGRLFSLTADGTTTEFLYDGDALVGEYVWGNQTARYLHGTGADVPRVWYHGAGLTDRRWLHTDHQGSIVATSTGTGALGTLYTYDEYGIPGATSPDRFRYTGQIWLPELRMYHYKARIYSPTLGRFLQTDPIGYEDQFNLYAYVRNDPVNLVDPSGQTGYYVSRAAGGTGSLADHGFVVVADWPGGPIKAIYSYTDINGSLMSSENDNSQGSTLRTDVGVWTNLGTQASVDSGTTFNIIDATDLEIYEAGNAVDQTLQTGEMGYSTLPATTFSGCNSNCGAAAVANIARRESGSEGEHPAPDNSRWAPGRPQSHRIEDRLERHR